MLEVIKFLTSDEQRLDRVLEACSYTFLFRQLNSKAPFACDPTYEKLLRNAGRFD